MKVLLGARNYYWGGSGGGGTAGDTTPRNTTPAVAPSPWALAFTPPPPWSSELGLGRTCRLPAPVLGMPDLPWPPTVRELSLIHISEPTRLLSISYAVFCLK